MSIRFAKKPAVSAVLASLLLFLPCISHAEADALVRQANMLTEKDQGAAAFDLLEGKEAERAGDPDFDLVFGIAANQTAQFSRAIFALERVLLVQPDNARARAELGRALFAVGDTKAARTLLAQTKDGGVPVEVAKTIDQFLQAIDKVDEAGRSSIKGFVDFGFGVDSNVNSGIADSAVAVPNVTGLLTLSPSGVQTAANYATVGAGLSGRQVIDSRWSLIGNVAANLRWNAGNANQFDTQLVDLNGGASYRVDRNEYSLVLQAGSYAIGGTQARTQSGLVGEWIHRLDGFRQFSSYAQLSRLSYPAQSVRDVQRNVFGSSYAHLFRDGLMVFGGLYLGSESEFAAGQPQLGHRLVGLRSGVQKPFSDSVAAFATFGFEDRQFGGDDPTFRVTRKDQQANLTLGLSWVPAKAWRVTPQISYTRTTSNIVINDFSKTAVGFTVRREF